MLGRLAVPRTLEMKGNILAEILWCDPLDTHSNRPPEFFILNSWHIFCSDLKFTLQVLRFQGEGDFDEESCFGRSGVGRGKLEKGRAEDGQAGALSCKCLARLQTTKINTEIPKIAEKLATYKENPILPISWSIFV